MADCSTILVPFEDSAKMADIYGMMQARGMPEIDLLPYFTCSAGCNVCSEHFLSIHHQQKGPEFKYAGVLTEDEARHVCEDLVHQARDDREYLREKLSTRGDTLMNKWKKSSKAGRSAKLLQADPDLASQKWVLQSTICSGSKWQSLRNDRTRKALLLPYLSVELLQSNPSVLFGLLYNRLEFSPEEWAPWDKQQLQTAWDSGLLDCKFYPGCIIMNGHDYGKLTKQSSPTFTHRGDCVGFPRAQLVLEAQCCLVSFLRRLVDLILCSATGTQESCIRFKEMGERGYKISGDVALWSTFTNQPFSAPPLLDIDKLVSLAEVRMSAAADHLALLQTDLSYLRRFFDMLSMTVNMKVLNTQRRLNVLATALHLDVETHFWWRLIKEHCEHIRRVQRRVKATGNKDQKVYHEYVCAILELDFRVKCHLQTVQGNVTYLVTQAPGMVGMFKRESSPFGYGTWKLKLSMEERSELFGTDRLAWCLLQLAWGVKGDSLLDLMGIGSSEGNKRTDWPQYDAAHVLWMLEDQLAISPPHEKARVGQRLMEQISDYTAVHQLRTYLDLRRPKQDDDLYEYGTDDSIHSRIIRSQFSPMAEAPGDPRLMMRMKLLGNTIKDFQSVVLPTDKLGHAWLDQFDKSHAALNAIWDEMLRETRYRYRTMSLRDSEVVDFTQVLTVNTSPAHNDVVAAERQRAVDQIAQLPENMTKKQAPAANTGEQPVQSLKREKIKTRPHNDSQVPKEDQKEITGHTTSESVTIPPPPPQLVTKRALTVLYAMYPTTTTHSSTTTTTTAATPTPTPKTIDWDSFVHAMSDLGFKARNGGGSTVVFENARYLENGRYGKIAFHRPHPGNRIDPVMLRAMGKRCGKWFGWGRDGWALEGVWEGIVGKGMA